KSSLVWRLRPQPPPAPAPGYGYTNSRDLVRQTISISSQQSTYGGGAHDGFYIYFFGGNYPQPSILSYFGGSADDRILAVASSGVQCNQFSSNRGRIVARRQRRGSGYCPRCQP